MNDEFHEAINTFLDSHPGAGDYYFSPYDNRVSADWARAWTLANDPVVLGLVEASTRLLERINHNAIVNKDNGIGEYKGGPAFVVQPMREALAAYEAAVREKK